MRLLWNFNSGQEMHGSFFGLGARCFAHPDRRQRSVFHNQQMRKQVKMLKHHANLTANFIDVFHVIIQLDSMHGDITILMPCKPVQTPDQR